MPIHLKTTPQEAAAYAARRKRKTTASSSSSSLWIEEESRIYDNVPQRWRTSFDEFLHVDPDSLDGDDYTEWVRTGMYRKAHREEYEEEQRVKAEQRKEQAHHRANQRALKEQLRRNTEKELEESRLRRRRKLDTAREEYDLRWQTLLTSAAAHDSELTFHSIPWPIFTNTSFGLEDITLDGISAFLLPPDGKLQKDKLREALLRFHPDKFEGRFMTRVVSQDQQIVREALGRVVRALNDLMASQ